MYINFRNKDKCKDCGFCRYFISCYTPCTGCGACEKACPYEANELLSREKNMTIIDNNIEKNTEIVIDGKEVIVPLNITVLKALELNGYKISHNHPHSGDIFAPCNTGGCWTCSVIVNGEILPSCVTPVEQGMAINTESTDIEKKSPQMVASYYFGSPHSSSGMHEYSQNNLKDLEEVSCLLHGCNLNCPCCQNWNLTFSSIGKPKTPKELATNVLKLDSVSWISISGGEPTLNRRWLIDFLSYLKYSDRGIRIHLDTNGTVLSTGYMDKLNDLINYVTLDIKGADIETYQFISGIKDRERAFLFMENSWNALEYFFKNCKNILVVACIPLHPKFVSGDELSKIGERLSCISPEIPVSIIEYQAAFRQRALPRIKPAELESAYEIIKKFMKNVEVQFISSAPVDPQDILLQ